MSKKIPAGLALALMLAFFAMPLFKILHRGLVASPAAGALVGADYIVSLVATTLALSLAGVTGSLALGIPMAYFFYKFQSRWAGLFQGLAFSSFFMPTIVVGLAFHAWLRDWLTFLSESGDYVEVGDSGSIFTTSLTIVAALVFFNYSVVMRMVGTAWQSLDPKLIEVSRTLGGSWWRTFRQVVWPHLKNSIWSAALIVFLFCSSSYGLIMVLGSGQVNTIETGIYYQAIIRFDLKSAAVLCIVQLVFVLLVLLGQRIFQNQQIRRQQIRSVKLVQTLELASAGQKTGFRLCGIIVTVISLLPLLSLAGQAGIDWTTWARFTEYNRYLGGSLANALWYSASVALQATVITLLITALVVSARAKWLNDLVTVPLGISSVILGFGFLITFGAAFWVLPIAQALVALPMVVWTVSPILDRLEPKLFEVATMLQVSKWRKFKTIALPVLQRAVLVGAGFAFAISLGEFGASSFLIRPNQPTLPVAIYRLFGVPGHNNYQLAVLGALSLLVVTVLFSIVVAQSARQGFMRWGCRPLSNSIPRKPSPRSASSLFVLPGFRENHTCDIRSQINNQANPLSYRDTGQ